MLRTVHARKRNARLLKEKMGEFATSGSRRARGHMHADTAI